MRTAAKKVGMVDKVESFEATIQRLLTPRATSDAPVGTRKTMAGNSELANPTG